jgi:hypothetical protein
MKGHPIRYSPEELAWLETNRLLPVGDYHRQFVEAFPTRIDVTPGHLHALRKRKGWKTGRTGQFVAGQESWNKGKPMPSHPNSAAHQFRKGQRSGVAERLWKPIGTERVSKEGYIERKINDDMPLRGRWRAVHLIRWEELNGPLPKGHCLKCLDGNKANTDPENWTLIPRALLPRLNGGARKQHLAFDEAEPEVKPALLALAKLDRAARERSRKESEHG